MYVVGGGRMRKSVVVVGWGGEGTNWDDGKGEVIVIRATISCGIKLQTFFSLWQWTTSRSELKSSS